MFDIIKRIIVMSSVSIVKDEKIRGIFFVYWKSRSGASSGSLTMKLNTCLDGVCYRMAEVILSSLTEEQKDIVQSQGGIIIVNMSKIG